MGLFSRHIPAATDRAQACAQADGIAVLMRARLGARGADLREVLSHSGHDLPRAVRREAEVLAQGAELARHPRLIQRLDAERMAEAERVCREHLEALGPWARRGAAALAVLRRVAGIGLATGALAVGLAVWRGLL
ncbi:MAG: hypothetical protein ACXIUV_13135 [Alkalilacustris sp.]